MFFWIYPSVKHTISVLSSGKIASKCRQNVIMDYLKGALTEARNSIVKTFFGESIGSIVLSYLNEDLKMEGKRSAKEWGELEKYGSAEYSISFKEEFEIESALL